MPRKLIRMKVDRIDLVDKGANQLAHIVLAKRVVVKDSPAVGDVHVDVPGDERDEYEKSLLSSETRNSLPDSAFAAVWTDSSGKKQRKLPYKHADGSVDTGHLTAALGRIGGAGIPSDIKSRAQGMLEAAQGRKKEKSVGKNILKSLVALFKESDETKRATALENLSKEIDDESDDDDKTKLARKADDAMAKRDAEISKAMTDLKAENEALKKSANDAMSIAKAEREARLDREMVGVLKSFKATPLNLDLADPKNDVAKFRKMQEHDPELYGRMIDIMVAQDKQLSESAMFKQFGSSHNGSQGNAWAQIEAKADQLVTKSATPMTREDAVNRVMFDNPKLVEQYRAEQQ